MAVQCVWVDVADNLYIALSVDSGKEWLQVDNPFVMAIDYLRTANVNVGLEFTLDNEQFTLFMVRLTPWRNSSRDGSMILVAEYTLEDALVSAAEQHNTNRWIPLNWRVRMNERGIYAPGRSWTVLRNARNELEKLPETPDDTPEYQVPEPPKKTR